MAHAAAHDEIKRAFTATGLSRSGLAKRMGWSWMRLDRALRLGPQSRDCDALCGALGIVFEIPMPAGIPSVFIGRCREGSAMADRLSA